MRKAILFSLISIFLVLTCITSFCFASSTQTQKTVRVGWFYSNGVHDKDENGIPFGYDYDYLQAISHYTNWEYEYIEGTWSECYNWLKNGEIDLLGIVNKTPEREKHFDYSYTSTGTEMCCLFVALDNKHYTYQNFKTFSGMTIAIEEGTYQSEVLKEYAKNNDFTYSTKTYPTLAEAQKALNNNEVDALLSSNTDVIRGYKTIAQFNPVPYYFATTKGNTELLSELNGAINELFAYYPQFSSDLYIKYYGNNNSPEVVLTKDELDYISSFPVVKVLYDPIWYPIESYDEKNNTYTGIVPDLLNLISERSGIKFIYEDCSSVEVLKKFESSDYNLISSITYDYNWAVKNKVKITQPFIDASIMCVTRSTNSEPKTVALVELDYISEMVKKFLPNLEIKYFDSMSKCIEAVKKGQVDCTYLNNYEAEYYMSIAKYRNLNFHTIDLFRQKLCLGISNESDPLLFSIISKSLQNITSNEIQNLIYENSYHASPVTLVSFARSNPQWIIVIVVSFLLVILSGLFFIFKNQIKNSRKLAIENERYNQLAEITEVHFYEYSYKTDFLKFNNIPSSFFNGKTEIPNYTKFLSENLEENETIDNTLYSCFIDKKDEVKEIKVFNFDKSQCWYRVTTKIIKDTHNEAIYAIGKIQNIQNEYEEKLHLIDCANRDSMTKLLNVKAFEHQVSDSICEGSSLFIMDIDYFKQINDNFGHYNGDKALKEIAKTLKSVFGNIGVISRLGGDEFSVFIQKEMKTIELTRLCERFLNEVAKIKVTKDSPNITMSIGVSISSKTDTYIDVFKRADKLLYDIKHNTKNDYKIETLNVIESSNAMGT
ncbi:MAG: diguanylate cyclase domain-containing protein [Aminipila sp.]